MHVPSIGTLFSPSPTVKSALLTPCRVDIPLLKPSAKAVKLTGRSIENVITAVTTPLSMQLYPLKPLTNARSESGIGELTSAGSPGTRIVHVESGRDDLFQALTTLDT